VCADGYSRTIGYQCTRNTTGKTVAASLGIVALVVLYTLMIYLMSKRSDDSAASELFATDRTLRWVRTTLHYVQWGQFRIAIVALQIATQYANITGLRLPSVYSDFLKWLYVVNVDVAWLLAVAGIWHTNFYQRLLLNTLVPLAAVAVLGGTYIIARRRGREASHEFRLRSITPSAYLDPGLAMSRLSSMLLAMTWLLYTTTSTTAFQAFVCDTIDDGAVKTSYLRADYSIQCDTAKHSSFLVHAALMIVLYPIGILVLYAWLLWRSRHKLRHIYSSSSSSGAMPSGVGGDVVRPASFLWIPYTAKLFYWELYECLRRVLLTSLVVFMVPGSSLQPVIASVLAVVSTVAAAYDQPHAGKLLHYLHIVLLPVDWLHAMLSRCVHT
jgi:hypothetical protein